MSTGQAAKQLGKVTAHVTGRAKEAHDAIARASAELRPALK